LLRGSEIHYKIITFLAEKKYGVTKKKGLLYMGQESRIANNFGTFHGTLFVKHNFVTAVLERALRDIMIILLLFL